MKTVVKYKETIRSIVQAGIICVVSSSWMQNHYQKKLLFKRSAQKINLKTVSY